MTIEVPQKQLACLTTFNEFSLFVGPAFKEKSGDRASSGLIILIRRDLFSRVTLIYVTNLWISEGDLYFIMPKSHALSKFALNNYNKPESNQLSSTKSRYGFGEIKLD